VKGGTENRKKTIIAGVLVAAALCCIIYSYNMFFGGTSTPAPTPAPAKAAAPVAAATSGKPSSTAPTPSANGGAALAPGVAAVKMASTSSSLDPTLDESAMLRTEGLVYSGSGRNIFSATYVAEVAMPTNVPNPRQGPPIPTLPPVQTGPPPPPPIDLKFFGTAVRTNGLKQAFLLNGEDVYLASVGDIVARKYKIVSIGTINIQVEDLLNKDTQTLPLQSQP
jgi:hypothetical protein